MPIVTVYDLDGCPHEKEAVDARECVAEMGWTFNASSAPVENASAEAAQAEADKAAVPKGKK